MKERLTDAALDLIWHNSYGATSVDAICERAGAKKGSFYYFFKSKAALTAAALEAEWNKNKKNMDALFSPTIPPLERFDGDLVVRRRVERPNDRDFIDVMPIAIGAGSRRSRSGDGRCGNKGGHNERQDVQGRWIHPVMLRGP